MTKPTVRPAKTQISLGIRPVWSESSLCAQWVAKDPMFLHADSEDWSDWADAQADWVFAGRTVGFVMSQLISERNEIHDHNEIQYKKVCKGFLYVTFRQVLYMAYVPI